MVKAKRSYERKDRLIQEKRHDAYQEQGKWPEPTLCTECGAVFSKGRWTWKKGAQIAHHTTCPACKRFSQKYPAGTVVIKGGFFEKHRDEILNLVRNIGDMEENRHPMERILRLLNEKDHTLIETSGIHIARRIGEALARSYNGDYSFQYSNEASNIRVVWDRSA